MAFGSALAGLDTITLTTADGRTVRISSWPARMALRLMGVPHVGMRVRAALVMSAARECCPAPRRILDAGCGPGLYLAELARAFPGADLTGIDLQQGKLEQAGALLSALAASHTLLRADLTEAIPGKEYDLIVCSDVLEHIGNDRAAVTAMAGALSDAGCLLITVPAASRFSSLVAADFDHKRDGYTLETLQGLLDAAGLDVVRHRQYFKGPGRLAWRINRSATRWPALAAALFPPLFGLARLDQFLPGDREAGGLMVTAMKKTRHGPRPY